MIAGISCESLWSELRITVVLAAHPTAVDHQRRAVHVARGIGCKEYHSGSRELKPFDVPGASVQVSDPIIGQQDCLSAGFTDDFNWLTTPPVRRRSSWKHGSSARVTCAGLRATQISRRRGGGGDVRGGPGVSGGMTKSREP